MRHLESQPDPFAHLWTVGRSPLSLWMSKDWLLREKLDAAPAGVGRWTENSCNVYDLISTRLAQLITANDRIIEAWAAEAQPQRCTPLTRSLR